MNIILAEWMPSKTGCNRPGHTRQSREQKGGRSPLGSPVKVGESATTLTGSAVLFWLWTGVKGAAPPGGKAPPPLTPGIFNSAWSNPKERG
jgi:hypothetical protein